MQWLWFVQAQKDVTCFVLGTDLLVQPIHGNNTVTVLLDASERGQWSKNGILNGCEKGKYNMPGTEADHLECYASRL